MLDRTGQHIGNYRLTRLGGGGAFADVYLGEHLLLRTQVAVKVLRSSLASSSQQAFLREAQIIAQLEHPHIIRVQDFGIATGTNMPILVMEYTPHGSLRERYPRGTRLTATEIVSYVRQIAAALQYAHERQVIHRNVKPENVLLGRHNEVLLTDFGMAFLRRWSSHRQWVGGTPGYVAPELSWSDPLPASDQYALAVMVYEWFSQSHPYQSPYAPGQYTFHPVPLRERLPALPAPVNAVVMTALAKNPQQRFHSIQAFAAALEQACQPLVAGDAPVATPVNSEQEELPVPIPVPSAPVPPPPLVWSPAWGGLIASLVTRALLGCLVALGAAAFDLSGLPLILGNWQHSTGLFWGSLASSVVLLVCALRRSFKPVLGYLAVFIVNAAWGTVGWIVGTGLHFRWLPSLVLPILCALLGFLIAFYIHSSSLPVMVRTRYL